LYVSIATPTTISNPVPPIVIDGSKPDTLEKTIGKPAIITKKIEPTIVSLLKILLT
jgi:hypothetical protein